MTKRKPKPTEEAPPVAPEQDQPPKTDVSIVQVTRHLPVVLSDHERLKIGDDLGRTTQTLQAAERRKKEVTSQLTADIETHKSTLVRLGTLLANGYEERPVTCDMTIDRLGDRVTVVRKDTGEIVECRTLTNDERQAMIQFPDDPPPEQYVCSTDEGEEDALP